MLAVCVILQDLLALVLFSPSETLPAPEDPPLISVLLAARDEEKTIGRCLDALLAQDYPALEILVGDDGSADSTAEVVREYARQYPHIHYIRVPEEYGDQKAKAKVLAWLARKARGEHFLITDADVQSNPAWASEMSAALSAGEYDLVNGVTRVTDSYFQDMEWVHALGLLRTLAKVWRPVTGLGNNMAITRQAYEALGGYEEIPFSLTEDRALFVAAHIQGYRLRQLFASRALGVALPVRLFGPYLSQRKRWLTGAVRLPVVVQLLLGIQSLFIVYCVGLAFIWPLAGAILFAVRLLVRIPLWFRFYRGLGSGFRWWHAGWFEVAGGLMNLLLLFYVMLSGRVVWKGRKY